MKTFVFPKIVLPNNFNLLLTALETAFGMENKSVPNVLIDLSKVSKTSLLGVLMNYKFIEYTYKHNCFHKPEMSISQYMGYQWEKYGFTDLIHSFISNRDITESRYRNLEVKVEKRFIIAPQPLLRQNNYSETALKNKFLPKIEAYYNENSKTVSMIFLCLSEIILNFWEHAMDDTNSILVAEGNQNHIEIVCADTGNGIISTVSKVLDDTVVNLPDKLKKAVEKGVTSKKMSNHMGYGLWILNEITTRTNGRFHIYSEGAYYKNDFGKELTNTCGYWKGTIIYLSLPLSKPITLSDIENHKDGKLSKIKINWK